MLENQKIESKALQDAFHNCNFDLVMMTFWVRLKKTRKQTQSRLRFDLEKLIPGCGKHMASNNRWDICTTQQPEGW